MRKEQSDILISGAGLAGLIAALGFAKSGYKVVLVDPAPVITSQDQEGADLRTTAFLQPAKQFLDQIGVWSDFAPHATPLQQMRIVEASDHLSSPAYLADFDAGDISDAPFGWNLPNWQLRKLLMAHIQDNKAITFLPETAYVSAVRRDTSVHVRLSNDTNVICQLLVGADGRDSQVRADAGIKVQRTELNQWALTCAVSHDVPHENISTEIHKSGGPFTLVPLHDYEGQPCSAIVWMNSAEHITKMMALDEDAFSAKATVRSADLYGPLKLVSKRMTWPLIMQRADKLYAQRTALIAEAAHVVPPIGAQGLNMSLNDVETLIHMSLRYGLGSDLSLSSYHKKRIPDLAMRLKGVGLLNKMSMTNQPLAHHIRSYGLKTINTLGPLKKRLMHLGLGGRRVKGNARRLGKERAWAPLA